VNEGIKLFGTKGGGLRYLYADFLNEAATVLGNQALATAAAQYTALGGRWQRFADAVLPDHIAPLGETRRLLEGKYALFLEQGGAGFEKVGALSRQLIEMEEELNSHFPISDEEVMALFEAMQSHLEGIYEAELEAQRTLSACLN
jgi:hypothetical protein